MSADHNSNKPDVLTPAMLKKESQDEQDLLGPLDLSELPLTLRTTQQYELTSQIVDKVKSKTVEPGHMSMSVSNNTGSNKKEELHPAASKCL